MKCDFCGQALAPQYHLNMSDGSMRNFCSHGCVTQFQSSFNKQPNTGQLENTPRPTGIFFYFVINTLFCNNTELYPLFL